MKNHFKNGLHYSQSAHTIYIHNFIATVALLNNEVATITFTDSESQNAFILGAASGEAAIVINSEILKQCTFEPIKTNPFPLLRKDWWNHHPIWRQVTEDLWEKKFKSLPPLFHNGNRWLQSETVFSSETEAVYLAGKIEDSTYYLKYQTISQYHHERLHEPKIIKQLASVEGKHGSIRATVNGFPGSLWSQELPQLTDSELTTKAAAIKHHPVWIEGHTIYAFLSDYRYTDELARKVSDQINPTFYNPTWGPLEQHLSDCSAWMYMSSKKWGRTTIHSYKHSNTRQTIHISEDRRHWVFENPGFQESPNPHRKI